MAISVAHSTAADGTFSATGATAWNAAHSLTGFGTGVEAALAVNVGSSGAPVLFNGALGTPSSATLTNATGLRVGGISATGTPGAGNFLRGDGTWAAASGSSTWDTIGAAAGDGTTANGTNRIVYQTAPTANTRIAWRFTESSAATNGTSTSGIPNQVLLKLDTLAASTQSPLSVYSRAVHAFSVSPSAPQVIFNGPNSSLSAPAITFSDALTTGFYHGGAGTMVACSRGGTSFQWDGAQLWANPGSAGAPSITDLSNATTGMFFGLNFMAVGDSTANELFRFTGGASKTIKASAKLYPATDGGASQSSCALYGNTGAPNNANGADGDIYFRADGGALTTIYQRRAGAWVGVV